MHCVVLAGAFYALCAALALYMFYWQFPSPGTPLFSTNEGPVAVLLKQARGGGMVLAGERLAEYSLHVHAVAVCC